ncbi:TRAP transporter large permease subunit [Aliikangiella marina]|uniref:TRAP transporter large permease protein n=1 Tax=Aliikangiella marina TaxID=1712262 RepID=A0A545T4R0_9GAMM|nr:TRAP transporter large permease subunit [Aliikangiella marina]TQV72214.1 TRAP transporter large permease subunit [Aliikangiella marina]
MMEWIPLIMFLTVCLVLLAGYPVAFSLAGTALVFAGIGVATGELHPAILKSAFSRLFGLMQNQTLIAVPLFVFMGVMLEKSRIAERLLTSMASLFAGTSGGLAISVVIVGALLAASTGIVGATVVTMGLLSLPVMLKNGYSPSLSTGVICASGTLGQIIPPSIVLVLLGDVIASANRDAGVGGTPVSVGDLFAGALIPGLILVVFYILYVYFYAKLKPEQAPVIKNHSHDSQFDWRSLVPPLVLILTVLGSILSGVATPSEAAALGAIGAVILAIYYREFTLQRLKEVARSTTKTSSMVFMILIGASIFSLVFRAFEGDDAVQSILSSLPGGLFTAMLLVMFSMFLLGFILDFIEIVFVVVPLTAPALLAMGVDPIWLGIMIAVNLQTSFLTPPFGFALFYLRGVAPKEVKTAQIYKGVLPFILIQVVMLIIMAIWPEIVTWLPNKIYG